MAKKKIRKKADRGGFKCPKCKFIGATALALSSHTGIMHRSSPSWAKRPLKRRPAK
jgi:phage FluMu protein Com